MMPKQDDQAADCPVLGAFPGFVSAVGRARSDVTSNFD